MYPELTRERTCHSPQRESHDLCYLNELVECRYYGGHSWRLLEVVGAVPVFVVHLQRQVYIETVEVVM